MHGAHYRATWDVGNSAGGPVAETMPRELKTAAASLSQRPGSSSAQRAPHPLAANTGPHIHRGTHTRASIRTIRVGGQRIYDAASAAPSKYRRPLRKCAFVRALYCFPHVYIHRALRVYASTVCDFSQRNSRSRISRGSCRAAAPRGVRVILTITISSILLISSLEFYFLALCIKRRDACQPAVVGACYQCARRTHSRSGNAVVIPTRAYTTGNVTRTLYIVLTRFAGMPTGMHHCNGDWV